MKDDEETLIKRLPNHRLKALLALLVATGLMLLAGCGGDDSDDATEASADGGGEKVTLRLMMPTSQEPGFEAVIDAMEKTDLGERIDVEGEYIESSDLPQALLTQLQAGNAPDMFWAQGGSGGPNGVWPLAEAGELLDLSGRDWEDEVYAPSRDFVSFDGNVYGFPVTVIGFGIMVNDELVDELGITLPENFADLISICEELAGSDQVDAAFTQGFGELQLASQVGQQLLGQFVYNVSPDWNEKRAAGEVTFADSKEWQRTLQSLVDMNEAGCFPKGAAGTNKANHLADFAEGGGPFLFGTATDIWAVNELNPDLVPSLINLPADNAEDTSAYMSASVALGANADSANPDEVLEFVDFMATEESLAAYAEASTSTSPTDATAGKVPEHMSALSEPLAEGKVVGGEMYAWPNPLVFNDVYLNGLLGLITGQATVDEILKNMDAAWEEGG